MEAVSARAVTPYLSNEFQIAYAYISDKSQHKKVKTLDQPELIFLFPAIRAR